MDSDDQDSSTSSFNSDNVCTSTKLLEPAVPPSSSGTSNGTNSLLEDFDDIIQPYRKIRLEKAELEKSYADFAEQTLELLREHAEVVEKCRQQQILLEQKAAETNDLEHKLHMARSFLDDERNLSRIARRELNDLKTKIEEARGVVLKEKEGSNRIPREIRQQLLSLLPRSNAERNSIVEISSSVSTVSDFSYSRSENDLDESLLHSGTQWKKHRPSTGQVTEPATKKRRSSIYKAVDVGVIKTIKAIKDGTIKSTSSIECFPQASAQAGSTSTLTNIGVTATIKATTTFIVSKDDPIKASSITSTQVSAQAGSKTLSNLEPSHSPSNLVVAPLARDSPRNRDNIRQHSFQQKTMVMPDTCGPCSKRIRFGKTAVKCKDCKAVCHTECKDKLPLPCIPAMNTPNRNGKIGDYAPTTPPMVPAILIHCVNEIELRGLNEEGLYRIPGTEREVKALKERFLKGKGAPCLSNIDIHVICGTVKEFLRSLSEPLVTYGLWKEFVRAIENDPVDITPFLLDVIVRLPQPNRETLAYMIIHLQRVSQSKECKMGLSNLAKMFAQTIVGYSSEDPDPNELLNELAHITNVMEHLLKIPEEYWSSYINMEVTMPSLTLEQIPSADSLLKSTATGGTSATHNRHLLLLKRRHKYFDSPKA